MVGGEGLIEIGTKSLSLHFYFFEGFPKSIETIYRFRFTPYSRKNQNNEKQKLISWEPIIHYDQTFQGTKIRTKINAKFKWLKHNEIIISKTLLENVSSSCSKIEISIQLNPHDTELKSFFADVSTETNSNGTETNKFIGPIVIFLKAELTDTYEEKLSSLSSQEEKVRNVSVCFQVLIEC